MPWEHGAARSCTYCHICCGGASFWHFAICMTLVYIVVYLFIHHYFGWRGYTNYQMLGNGDIRSLHMFLVLFLLLYFRVRRPGLWESRTVSLYCICVHVSLSFLLWYCWLFLDGVMDGGYLYWYTYTYRLVVGIGRESALEYLYVLIACLLPFGAPSLYSDRVVCCPSNRWTLSVFLQKL